MQADTMWPRNVRDPGQVLDLHCTNLALNAKHDGWITCQFSDARCAERLRDI